MRKNIWLNNENTEGASALLIAKAERKLGVTLPNGYVALLKIQNGGYLEYDAFPTDFSTSWAKDHINVTGLYGIETTSCLLKSAYLIKEWGLPDNILLISGDGHTWIALDYRMQTENPPVILIDEEGAGIKTLASDFETFVEGLTKKDTCVNLVETDFIGDDEEKTKKYIAEQLRNGRTNEEIKREIDHVVLNHTPKQVERYLETLYGLRDADVELYMIRQLVNYDSKKVRVSLGGYLLACAMGNNDTLTTENVKEVLLEMEKLEENRDVRFFIEASLEYL